MEFMKTANNSVAMHLGCGLAGMTIPGLNLFTGAVLYRSADKLYGPADYAEKRSKMEVPISNQQYISAFFKIKDNQACQKKPYFPDKIDFEKRFKEDFFRECVLRPMRDETSYQELIRKIFNDFEKTEIVYNIFQAFKTRYYFRPFDGKSLFFDLATPASFIKNLSLTKERKLFSSLESVESTSVIFADHRVFLRQGVELWQTSFFGFNKEELTLRSPVNNYFQNEKQWNSCSKSNLERFYEKFSNSDSARILRGGSKALAKWISDLDPLDYLISEKEVCAYSPQVEGVVKDIRDSLDTLEQKLAAFIPLKFGFEKERLYASFICQEKHAGKFSRQIRAVIPRRFLQSLRCEGERRVVVEFNLEKKNFKFPKSRPVSV